MKFSRTELEHLAIAWIVLGLCFTLANFGGITILRGLKNPLAVREYFLIILIAVGTAFIFHELAHKLVAQLNGYKAEFRLWNQGLIIAIILALFSPIIFAAPGAVYILASGNLKKEVLISASGVVVNLIMASIFFFLLFIVGSNNFLGKVAGMGFFVNLWLAAFNLLPVPPLDGSKVMSANFPLWIILVVISWGALALRFMGLI